MSSYAFISTITIPLSRTISRRLNCEALNLNSSIWRRNRRNQVVKLKGVNEMLTEEEITAILGESNPDNSDEIDFEALLREYLNLQARAIAKLGGTKHASSFVNDQIRRSLLIALVRAPHLVLGLISQLIKIQLLDDLNLKKTPQLLELVDDSQDVEELINLPPEKMLLKWMNFHHQKAGYKKQVANFSSD